MELAEKIEIASGIRNRIKSLKSFVNELDELLCAKEWSDGTQGGFLRNVTPRSEEFYEKMDFNRLNSIIKLAEKTLNETKPLLAQLKN